jgi:iron complex outermembrane receptor protein
MNLGAIRASGVDVSASATLDTRVGRFKPEVSGAWVRGFTVSNLVEGANVDRVGVANVQGTIPQWRAVASLSWTWQGFGLMSSVRYVPSYDDVAFFGGRNGRKVASQAIVDAQLSVDLGEVAGGRSPWSGFELRIGAFNVFDDEPPFTEVAFFNGYDVTQADLRQRFAYVKLAKTF